MAEENEASLINRIRYRKDDPRRYLTVPVAERQTQDTGPEADARDEFDFSEEGRIDREEIRNAGEVVSEEDLQ